MKFRIVLEFDADTNSFSAVCPELPGCASAGDTEEEVRANIEEAIRLYLTPSEISLPTPPCYLRSRSGDRATPRLTADQVVRVLKRHNFALVGQSGSHQEVSEGLYLEAGHRSLSSRQDIATRHHEVDP